MLMLMLMLILLGYVLLPLAFNLAFVVSLSSSRRLNVEYFGIWCWSSCLSDILVLLHYFCCPCSSRRRSLPLELPHDGRGVVTIRSRYARSRCGQS
jgi:hypothetical protein